MLHSKFSLSFDLDDQSVTIFISHKVNKEWCSVAPTFYFNNDGKLIIPPNSERGYNKSTFSYLARHIKTKVSLLKERLEDEYLREKSYEELPF
tara:strand:+ start:47 stop:325 length:279 start_codon:yes stop_codon:yes gene_type:complete